MFNSNLIQDCILWILYDIERKIWKAKICNNFFLRKPEKRSLLQGSFFPSNSIVTSVSTSFTMPSRCYIKLNVFLSFTLLLPSKRIIIIRHRIIFFTRLCWIIIFNLIFSFRACQKTASKRTSFDLIQSTICSNHSRIELKSVTYV